MYFGKSNLYRHTCQQERHYRINTVLAFILVFSRNSKGHNKQINNTEKIDRKVYSKKIFPHILIILIHIKYYLKRVSYG